MLQWRSTPVFLDKKSGHLHHDVHEINEIHTKTLAAKGWNSLWLFTDTQTPEDTQGL